MKRGASTFQAALGKPVRYVTRDSRVKRRHRRTGDRNKRTSETVGLRGKEGAMKADTERLWDGVRLK